MILPFAPLMSLAPVAPSAEASPPENSTAPKPEKPDRGTKAPNDLLSTAAAVRSSSTSKSLQSSLKMDCGQVKWSARSWTMISFLLLVPAAALTQGNPRELVSKMVENELASQKQTRYWMYLDSNKKAEKNELDRVIQMPECWISWPVSINGHPPTAEESKHARDQLERLVNDPNFRKKNRGEIDADRHKSAELLKMLPDAFLFTTDGEVGKSVKLKFRPNPEYRPPSNEAKVFHSMEGVLLIDAKQTRLARLSGKLVSDVEFGFGILGKLHKGGTFEVVQSEVTPNDWEVSLLEVHISGRALFFHTIGEQQHEVRSEFKMVPSNLSVANAASKVTSNWEPDVAPRDKSISK